MAHYVSLHRDESTTAAPGISPGVVTDDEILLRELFEPYHIENGEISPRAVSLSDLQEKGFSVHRKAFAKKGDLRRAIDRRLAKLRNGETWKGGGRGGVSSFGSARSAVGRHAGVRGDRHGRSG